MIGAPRVLRIAFAVRQIHAAKPLFELLFGGRFLPVEGVSGDTVRRVELDREDGGPILELVEPVDEDGAVARFIRKRGEGIHHVTLEVDDLDAALTRIATAGGRVVRTPSYYRDPHGAGGREAFLHPKDVHGVLFHLVEAGAPEGRLDAGGKSDA